ncbi:hypothetical protein PENTCL1PPCAC_13591, partial [Pristionchus entomophagus]
EIFALPNDVLRDIMRRMEIKDRLKLRITCRTFEKLVADTNAGYFDKGSIISCFKRRNFHDFHAHNRKTEMLAINFGDTPFKGDAQSATEFMQLRSRLFNGITFAKFELKVADSIPLEFTRNLIESFKIEELRFHVESQTQLEKCESFSYNFYKKKLDVRHTRCDPLTSTHSGPQRVCRIVMTKGNRNSDSGSVPA